MTDPIISRIELPRFVSVQDIEKELAKLWQEVAQSAELGAITRSCLFNLIVVTPESKMKYASDILEELFLSHPARLLFVQLYPADQNEDEETNRKIDAWVSARCRLPGKSGHHICGEQITLTARGNAVDELFGSIAPFLIGDLPVFLWWLDDNLFNGHLFESLIEIIDELIFDSEQQSASIDELLNLANTINRNRQIVITDLNWLRITPWRRIIAGIFDISQNMQFLSKINHVTTEYIVQNNLNQSLLLVGWLASRLNWQFQSLLQQNSDEMVIQFEKTEKKIKAEIKPKTNSEYGLLNINKLSFQVSDQNSAVRYLNFDLIKDGTCVSFSEEIQGSKSQAKLLQLKTPSTSELLAEALDSTDHETIYEETIALLSQLS